MKEIQNPDLRKILVLKSLPKELFVFEPQRWQELLDACTAVENYVLNFLMENVDEDGVTFEKLENFFSNSRWKPRIIKILAIKSKTLEEFIKIFQLMKVHEMYAMESEIYSILAEKIERMDFSVLDLISNYGYLEEILGSNKYEIKIMEKINNIDDIIFILSNIKIWLDGYLQEILINKTISFNPTLEEWENIYNLCYHSRAKIIQETADKYLYKTYE